MFGVDRRGRGRLVEARIELLRRLWSGEEIEVDGRRVRVTPLPYTRGRAAARVRGRQRGRRPARRAARHVLLRRERTTPTWRAAYLAEADRVGVTALGCAFPTAGVPLTVFVADDPDRAWAEIGEYLLVDALSYGKLERGPAGHGVGLVRDHASTS